MNVLEVSKKRPLLTEESYRQCNKCHNEEGCYEDFDNDLVFCKKECQEAYHRFDISLVTERIWNTIKVRFHVNQILSSSLMTKYLFLCEWLSVPDVRQSIMNLVLDDSLFIYQYPNLVSSCDNAVYMIGGNCLYSVCTDNTEYKRKDVLPYNMIHVCTSRNSNYGYGSHTFLSVVRDNDDDHTDAFTNMRKGNGEYMPMDKTSDMVDIANNLHTLIIRYDSLSNTSTLWGHGRNEGGIMGFMDHEMVDNLTEFHKIPNA